MHRRSALLCWLLPVLLVLGSFLGARFAGAAEVVPLNFNETVRQSEAVALGTVVTKNSRWGDASHRWMVTEYTFHVEEVLFSTPGKTPVEGTITLNYWGGTIGGETQGASDVRLPVVGERLLVMLRPGWRENVSATPTVGLNQGLFSIAGNPAAGGRLVLRDASGQALAQLDDGRLVRRKGGQGLTAGAPDADFQSGTAWLRANMAAIKAVPAKLPPTPDWNDPRIIKPFAKTPGDPATARSAAGSAAAAANRKPLEDAAAKALTEPTNTVPRNPAAEAALSAPVVNTIPPSTDYSNFGTAHLPIVVNQLPTSFYWSPEDQYQMSKWNYYASDVFHVYTTPKGTYNWPDGVFDLDGFPSSADTQRIYGYTWDSNTIGITFYRLDSSNFIIEADIALNPAFGFTLDDEFIYNGGNAQGFRQVMGHELGHMHGMNHQFNFLSIMDYMPAVFRCFGFPYMDDAQAIRANYPSQVVGRTDLAVYLYYASGYQSVSDASYPGYVSTNDTLTVSNYHVENVGTTTITTPTIEWYLTSARNYDSSYYSLGASTYSPSLNPFQYFNPGSVSRSFTVPAAVPTGDYYLAAFIRDDDGAGQGSFPFSNNKAFSRFTIHVNQVAVPAITSSLNPPSRVGVPFGYQITATNSPYYYSAYGLPDGLTINDSGYISGTPTTAGTYYPTLYAYNAGGTGSATMTLVVKEALPVITSNLNPPSRQGVLFGYQITATNSPTSYGATGLPAGLSVDTTTGKISGSPTNYGTYNVVIKAANSGGTGSATMSLVVKQAVPVITSSLNPPSRQGVLFGYQIIATNSPTSYAAFSLPAGLSLDTATGKISGYPTNYGTYNVTIKATNSGGTGTAFLNLVVKQAVPVITSNLNPPSRQGVLFGYQITATNNPNSYAAFNLPAGLSVDTATGKISGTPTVAGTFNVTIKATNSGGTGTAFLTIVVKQAAPVITSNLNPPSRQGVLFGYTITATNSPTSYAAFSLPAGLSLNTTTGRISGTPTAAGTYKVTIKAINSGGTGTAFLTIVVKPAL